MTVDALELLKPPVLHCTCGAEVVSAWDDKVKRHRMFVSNPRRGQFLIRRKPLKGSISRWEATWWGPRGGTHSLHECDGRIVEAQSIGFFGVGSSEERMSA